LGHRLRELLEAELPSRSPARTDSRYLAMRVRALLGTALGRETIPVPSERRVFAPPPPLPSERATGMHVYRRRRSPSRPHAAFPLLDAAPLIRSYPRRAHGEPPILCPAPSVERPIVRIGLRGRALVTRDSRAGSAWGLACSLQRSVKSACGTVLPGRGPRQC
jgi:hypothetical protein